MIKPCIICGDPVKVIGNPEIVACSNDYCIRTTETHISIHYVSESVVASKDRIFRNDFQADMFGQMHRATI